MLGLTPPAAGVATFTPTRFDDPVPGTCDALDCSLREAILAANSLAGPDAIALAAGAYTLSIPGTGEDAAADGDLDITGDLTITGEGPGVTVVDGNGAVTGERIFHADPVIGGASPLVDISGMTITGGSGSQGRGLRSQSEARVLLTNVSFTGNDGASFGGAILNQNDAVMNILNSTIGNNVSSAYGAGILNEGNASLTIVNSTVSENEGSYGGGLMNQNDATMVVQNSAIIGNRSVGGQGGGGLFLQNTSLATLTNVTVSGNSSETEGGGVFVKNSTTLTLTHSTITGNRADSDGDMAGEGGGIFVEVPFTGTMTLGNSIVAENTDENGEPDCSGPITSAGHNLVGIVSAGCPFTPAASDSTGTPTVPLDPELGQLAANGGPTQTHALLPGSPALDAAGTGGPSIDQRGAPRLGAPDIGAYERVLCRGRLVNVVGTGSNDILVGTSAIDGILALRGNDKLKGKAGPDGLCGGPGKDTLRGGGGKDRLDGGPGRDTCVGQGGKDKARRCERLRSIP